MKKFFYRNRRNIIAILVVLFIFIRWFIAKKTALNYSFNGVVQKVEYSKFKDIPTITVNGTEYDLMYNTWGTNGDKAERFRTGDTVIKKSGDLYIIIKHKK